MPRLALDPATWKDLERLLDLALDLPAGERERWLRTLPAEARVHEPSLRALLAHAGDGAGMSLELPRPGAGAVDVEPSVRPPPSAGDLLGPYRLVRPIGEGGMGAVWLAERWDGLLERQVALKLPRAAHPDAGLAERLARERTILSTLDHPNIARLHDAGVTPEGQPWLALEYVEGRALDAFVREERPDLRARLALFLQVAAAVAHAHTRLVVHRDLKPSNIVVDGTGRARLLDFGIAKLLEDGSAGETELTRLGGRALTPEYASPEQLRGEPIGVASDVYSAGVVLYELLTGERPCRPARASRAALEEAILGADPVRPSAAAAEPAARRALRGDLDTVVLRALRKRPAERYPTLDAFAEDVERWLAGRPVRAQPDRRAYRARKFVARHRLAVAAASAALVAVLAASGAALWQARVARRQQRNAEDVKDFIASIFRGADPYVVGRPTTAAELLRRARGEIARSFARRPAARVELLTIVGESLHGLQDLESAESALREAVAVGTRELGVEHPATLAARARLLPVLRLRGHVADLLPEADALLAALRRHPVELTADLVNTLWQASTLRAFAGRAEEAVPLAEEARAVAAARFGERHPLTAEAWQWLASANLAARRPAAALEAAERDVRLMLELAGGDARHPNVIQARLVLGRALDLAQQGALALEGLGSAVRDAREVFGPESTVLAYALPHLVRAELHAGRLRDALASSEEVMRTAARKVRSGSPQAVLREELRARVLLAARRPAEALPGLAGAAAAYRETPGPSHPTAVAASRRHALALALLGRLGEAEGVLAATAPGDTRLHAHDLEDAVPVPGTVRRLAGDAAGARAHHAAALAAVPEGPWAPSARMRLLAELGQDELALGHPAAAVEALEQALVLFERTELAVTPERADAMVGLGRARLALGRAAEALPLLEAADAFWRGFDAGGRSAGEAASWLRRCRSAAGGRGAAPRLEPAGRSSPPSASSSRGASSTPPLSNGGRTP